MKYTFAMRNLAFFLLKLMIVGRNMCNGDDALDNAMNKALNQFNIRGASVAYFDRVGRKLALD